MKALKVLQKIFVGLLIILFLLIVIPTTYMFFAKLITKKLQPTFFGYASAVVVSGSMSGTIEVNDLVITKTQKNYEINDIIMFVSQSGESLITHRIVSITEAGIRTKGDSNSDPDINTTSTDKIVGKVVKVIPNFGIVYWFLTSPWGILCIFGIGLLLIDSPYIVKKLTKEKNEKEKNFKNKTEEKNEEQNAKTKDNKVKKKEE